MSYIRINKRKGKYKIEYNGTVLHKEKDLEFVKGWLKNQVKDFRTLYLEI